MPGYVYILSNPSIPGLLKIGRTMDPPEQRLRQLNTTGVPLPFVLEACFLVANPEALEHAIHAVLDKHRPTQNREFFQLPLAQALELSLPLVIQATRESTPPKTGSVTRDRGLNENELYILQLLVSAGNYSGLHQWRLEDYTKLAPMDVEICVANLVAKKFVSRSRRSGSHGPAWCPTPKGTKFLVDNNLVEEWMRQQWWGLTRA